METKQNDEAVKIVPVAESKKEDEEMQETEIKAAEPETPEEVLIDDPEDTPVNEIKDEDTETPDNISADAAERVFPQIGAGSGYKSPDKLTKNVLDINEMVNQAEKKGSSVGNQELSREIGTSLTYDDGAVNEENYVERDEKNWEEIIRYRNSKRIVWGRISGIHHYEAAMTDAKGNYVLDKNNRRIPETKFSVEVRIDKFPTFVIYVKEEDFWMPAQQFGETYHYFEDNKEKSRVRREAVLATMLNAKIPLLITSADRRRVPGDFDMGGSRYVYAITASRKAAMDIMSHIYFFNNKNNGPDVDLDTVYDAHVLAVNSNAVEVECCGVETWIKSYDLTGRKYVSDCRDEVKPGQTLKVKIVRFHTKKKGDPLHQNEHLFTGDVYPCDHVYLVVSGRKYDTLFTPSAFGNIHVGDMYLGCVMSVNYEKKLYTVILENRVIASVPFTRVIGARGFSRGDYVRVTVERKAEKAGFVVGRADPFGR